MRIGRFIGRTIARKAIYRTFDAVIPRGPRTVNHVHYHVQAPSITARQAQEAQQPRYVDIDMDTSYTLTNTIDFDRTHAVEHWNKGRENYYLPIYSRNSKWAYYRSGGQKRAYQTMSEAIKRIGR